MDKTVVCQQTWGNCEGEPRHKSSQCLKSMNLHDVKYFHFKELEERTGLQVLQPTLFGTFRAWLDALSFERHAFSLTQLINDLLSES